MRDHAPIPQESDGPESPGLSGTRTTLYAVLFLVGGAAATYVIVTWPLLWNAGNYWLLVPPATVASIAVVVSIVGLLNAILRLMSWAFALALLVCQWQFSLRTLLLVVTVCAIVAAVVRSSNQMTRVQTLRAELAKRGDSSRDIITLGDDRIGAITSAYVDDALCGYIATFDDIYYLSLDGSKITDRGVRSLRRLRKLTFLGLEDSHVTDLGAEELTGLETLTGLDLGGTQISDAALRHISKLRKIDSLFLERTAVSDAGLAHLEPLKVLKELNLSGTGISDRGLAHLRHFPALKVLWLADTDVRGPGLEALADSSIVVLYLQGTKVTDEYLDRLISLRGLVRVDLQRTLVTKEGVDQLRKKLPSCKVIWP